MQKKNEKSQQGMFKSYAGDKQEVELKIQKKNHQMKWMSGWSTSNIE